MHVVTCLTNMSYTLSEFCNLIPKWTTLIFFYLYVGLQPCPIKESWTGMSALGWIAEKEASK